MRRKKTARNLLLAAALVALGIGLFLSPWLILRFRLWREAPEAEVLWAGSLAYGPHVRMEPLGWEALPSCMPGRGMSCSPAT